MSIPTTRGIASEQEGDVAQLVRREPAGRRRRTAGDLGAVAHVDVDVDEDAPPARAGAVERVGEQLPERAVRELASGG